MYDGDYGSNYWRRDRPYGLTLVTAPVGEPITLEEARAQVGFPEEQDDPILLDCLASARAHFEEHDDRRLLSQTYKLTGSSFHCGTIDIPLRPVQVVNSVKYRDGANVLQTLDPANYVVDLSGFHARIYLASGGSWPSTYSHPNAIEVEFVVGYGDAVTVADPLFDGTNYFVTITANWVVKSGVTLKTITGFHIDFDTAAPPLAEIECLVQAGSPLQSLARFTQAITEDALSADIVFPSTLPSPSTIVGGIPRDLIRALKLLMAHYFKEREDSIVGVSIASIPMGYKTLVGANRRLQI